ncbi:hypothetical protein [Streptomyces sp. NPDC006668]|uniref:hypothetical protein n=1 Tax=Streptomyces sp. NPDC006668 TaxID=3156903 RepID=UPI0033C90A52
MPRNLDTAQLVGEPSFLVKQSPRRRACRRSSLGRVRLQDQADLFGFDRSGRALLSLSGKNGVTELAEAPGYPGGLLMVLLSEVRECFDVGLPGEAGTLDKCGRLVIEVAGAFGRDDERAEPGVVCHQVHESGRFLEERRAAH